MPTGGQILADHLAAEGITHLFMVPGESFLGLLDALHDDARIMPVVARNEAGAVMMAEATAKLTGRPAAAVVTRGPGAANALAGFYIAAQDHTPLVLIVGLTKRTLDGRPAFQRIDLEGVFGKLAKSVAIADSAAALSGLLARAFETALRGRPGPVVVGVPEDVFLEQTAARPVTASLRHRTAPHPDDLKRLNLLLAHAERPLVIAGAPLWSAEAAAALARFAERYDVPVASAFRRQDRIDNTHRSYVGHLGLARDAQLAAGVRAADVVVVFGDCLGEVTTAGFSLLGGKDEEQKIVTIGEHAADHTPPFEPALEIPASEIATALALADLPTPGKTPPWPVWRRDLRKAYEATLAAAPSPGHVRLEEVIAELSRTLPADAIVCSGAGNYAGFLHRFYSYRPFPSQLAPISGTMGYGLPAAIAAKVAYPERTVIALAGDGCFQMTAQELATAAQLDLAIIVLVANNGVLGTIRKAQDERYPGRPTATTLVNPDFAKFAEASGVKGFTVTAQHDFAPALEAARRCGGPVLIDLHLDADALSPREASVMRRNPGNPEQ